MKVIHYGYRLFLLLFFPLLVQSQQYNHLYDYHTFHFNSDFLCAEQIAEKYMVVGSSLEGPLDVRNMQLSIVHTTFGVTYSPNYVYTVGGFPTRAVDLTQSTKDPNYVITANNYVSSHMPVVSMNIFKVRPADGTVAWARHFGKNDTEFRTIAITKNEEKGIYYVLGQYDYNYAGTTAYYIYLLAIRDNGTTLWEKTYTGLSRSARLGSADLLYNPRRDEVVVSGWIYENDDKKGALITEIKASDGSVSKAAIIPEIGKEKSFKINDMVLANERYVLVGELNTTPAKGFLLQINQGLTPHSAFSHIYSRSKIDISLSGIRSNPRGDLYASFEYQDQKHAPYPGLLEMDPDGKPISSYLYQVEDYHSTSGLLDIFDGQLMVIKGGTGFGHGNKGALSLVSAKTPLSEDASICAKRISLNDDEGAVIKTLSLFDQEIETVKETYVSVKEVETEVTNCKEESVKGRLAAPTSQSPAGETSISIYPNPSQGKVTIALNETAVEQFKTAEVINVLGEIVLTFKVSKTLQEVTITGREPGIYFVRFRDTAGETGRTERLIIY